MKELPDTKTLLELLQSAKEAEEKARSLYEMGGTVSSRIRN